MRKFMTFLLIAGILQSQAQDNAAVVLKKELESAPKIEKDAKDSSQKLWRKGGVFGLNLSQSNLSNWAAGGDDYSLSINTAISAFAYYKKGNHSWDNTANFNLGYINTTTQGARKNDDKVDIVSKYGYALKPKLDLSLLFNIRSQFFKGYNYIDANTKVLNSDFMAPGYIVLGLGLDYKPQTDLSIFFSPLTARWVIVNNDSLSAKGAYGVTPGKRGTFQLGAFGTVNYKAALNKNVSYTGRLDLFSDYLNHPENIAINMTNLFAVKISNILAVTYSLDLIYDDNVRLFGPSKNAPRLQVKSMIGVGLLVKIQGK
ncbi:MAG: hypothetical protein RLZZ28_2185 [Bacteroidota bacterium]|jgi:hypothetical protein